VRCRLDALQCYIHDLRVVHCNRTIFRYKNGVIVLCVGNLGIPSAQSRIQCKANLLKLVGSHQAKVVAYYCQLLVSARVGAARASSLKVCYVRSSIRSASVKDWGSLSSDSRFPRVALAWFKIMSQIAGTHMNDLPVPTPVSHSN
jgi:hypothetical protein